MGIVEKNVEKLSDILRKKPVNWYYFEKTLKEIEDINILSEKREETILTDLLHERYLYSKGQLVLKAIEIFIANGYDVKANDGRNGGIILGDLRYGHYGSDTLKIVKLLLDAGTPLEHKSKYAEGGIERIADQLEWSISGAWGPDADYEKANIFEAYYEIIEAYKAGKDYKSIDSYHLCFGEELTAVSFLGNASEVTEKNTVTEFPDKMVMWFGDIPLVVNHYMDFIVNPVFAEENKENFSDISFRFDKIIGAKLKKIQYINPITCYLDFDNGFRILFSNYKSCIDKRNGLFEIRISEPEPDEIPKITGIYGESGWEYGERTVEYHSKCLTLTSGNDAYLVYVKDGYKKTGLGIIRCSKELVIDNNRHYILSNIRNVKKMTKDGKLAGIKLKCDEGFLYIYDYNFGDLVAILTEQDVALNKVDFIPNKEKIRIGFATVE